jgi:hypothetical protein
LALHDSYKEQGIFLARLDNTATRRHVLWNTHEAPLLLKPQLPDFCSADDVRLRYVSLIGAHGISLAFDSKRPERLLGIAGYETALDDGTTFSKSKENLIWVHCPVRSGTEEIQKVWLYQHKVHSLRWTMLMASSV